MSYQYPTAVVFDLDFTLWPYWCDTHIAPPVKMKGLKIVDARGSELTLFKDVESILTELADQGILIIAASRTSAPDLARELLSLFTINDKPMIEYFHSLQWGEGSKVRHITRAAKELNIVSALKGGELILFDDERRNKDVQNIHCHFAHIDDYTGLTREAFESALMTWTSSRESD